MGLALILGIGGVIVGAILIAIIATAGMEARVDYVDPEESTTVEGPHTPELNLDGFTPGHLIDDDEFYSARAMTVDEVRQFLATWNAGCVPAGDGTPCIADYRENTPEFPADEYCSHAVDARDNSDAATIITDVSYACGISPAVLLTMLQKEQGLITASGDNLHATRYSIAMGYGCPDGPGAQCDEQYMGFATQVYSAAHQFQMYRAHPDNYGYRAGQDNDIAYNVDSACGSSSVWIDNEATAALYNYTPYQPNPTALAGGEDECSTWGNLNFYGLYHAWFHRH